MLQFNVSLVYNIINLIVLCLLLKHFLIKPVLGIMDKRQAMINEKLENVKSTKEEADALKSQYEAALKDARAESGRIVEEARGRAKKEYDRIVAEADKKAAEDLLKARESLEEERVKTMEELRGRIAEVALCAARQVSGSAAGAPEDLALYDRFIEEAGECHDPDSR